jgi:hypothetical protein
VILPHRTHSIAIHVVGADVFAANFNYLGSLHVHGREDDVYHQDTGAGNCHLQAPCEGEFRCAKVYHQSIILSIVLIHGKQTKVQNLTYMNKVRHHALISTARLDHEGQSFEGTFDV